MMGSTSTTISPSRSSVRRRTPCVDGCCGPMLRVMSCVCGADPSGIVGLAKSTRLMLPAPLFLGLVGDILAVAHPDKLLRLLVVLPHRIPGPVLGQEHAAQVRVAFELDAVHVEHLA